MLVVYSSQYITRLWCVFELAAKVRVSGVESIDLMPTAVCGAVGAPCVMCWFASTIIGIAAVYGVTEFSPETLPEMPGILVCFMLVGIINVALPMIKAAELQVHSLISFVTGP